jgi:hypothetical protein
MDCYNFNFAMAFTLGLAGIYTSTAVGFNPFWFHLDQLNWHSTVSVEHDASLSRLDLKDGDNHSPSLKHIEQLVKFAGTADGLSHQDFAAYRVFLEQPYPHSEWPGWVGTRLRCGEIGLIIGALGRGDFEVLGRRINTDWARSLFTYGKLPDDWVRQSRVITPQQVSDTTNAVIKRMEEIREADKKK